MEREGLGNISRDEGKGVFKNDLQYMVGGGGGGEEGNFLSIVLNGPLSLHREIWGNRPEDVTILVQSRSSS